MRGRNISEAEGRLEKLFLPNLFLPADRAVRDASAQPSLPDWIQERKVRLEMDLCAALKVNLRRLSAKHPASF